MPRAIQDSVAVITGASSGIGRATALEFARRGGTVVVAARRQAALDDLVRECEIVGGHALAIPTDVTDAQAVQALARRVIETFGRVDIWVNNAAVTLFGRLEETPLSDYRRVIETNLLGYVYGAYAILPYFREQGSGVLINVSSAKVPQPFNSAYVVSKFGIAALSECLRQELRDAPDIHVVTILPASIDTPLFQQGGNYTGRAVKPIEPVYDPEQVARAIIRAARRPRREIVVGGVLWPVLVAQRIMPGLIERLAARAVAQNRFQDRPADPVPGNLYEPMPGYAIIRGGWSRPRQPSAIPWIAVAGLIGVGVGLGLLGRSVSRKD